MSARHLTTALTLVVLCVVLVIGAVVGFNSLFAPLPGGVSSSGSDPAATCTPAAKRLRTSDVVVNVFNAGNRVGLAGDTLSALKKRGFQVGEAGNAPDGTKVVRAQVWIQAGEQDAGRLVGRQLGLKTPVLTGKEDLGDGVDVILGNKFRRLLWAPRSVKVADTANTCS